jgi:hypothetical protein
VRLNIEGVRRFRDWAQMARQQAWDFQGIGGVLRTHKITEAQFRLSSLTAAPEDLKPFPGRSPKKLVDSPNAL